MTSTSDRWASDILDALNKIAYSPSNTWNQATNYAALPDPTISTGTTWLVLASTGIWPVSKPSGWYFSNGIAWLFLGAYNPVVTGGNVAVLNFPTFGSTGEGFTALIPPDSPSQLLAADDLRKGFILNVSVGVVYIGVGFPPSSSKYSYRMTNHSVAEKDGFTGAIYALAEADPKTVYITEIK